MEHISVYATFPDAATARRIARKLLDARLIACANLFPITSLYDWDGAAQEDPEIAALMKTRQDRFREVEAALRAEHPYRVPCIVAFPLLAGHAPYLAWVDERTMSGSP